MNTSKVELQYKIVENWDTGKTKIMKNFHLINNTWYMYFITLLLLTAKSQSVLLCWQSWRHIELLTHDFVLIGSKKNYECNSWWLKNISIMQVKHFLKNLPKFSFARTNNNRTKNNSCDSHMPHCAPTYIHHPIPVLFQPPFYNFLCFDYLMILQTLALLCPPGYIVFCSQTLIHHL